MILLLGRNNLVEKYAKDVLKINVFDELVYYPGVTTHYTEYEECLREIKVDSPPVITSQNIEFIEFLLKSDLEFEVITIIVNNEIRKLSKKQAIKAKYEMGIELR